MYKSLWAGSPETIEDFKATMMKIEAAAAARASAGTPDEEEGDGGLYQRVGDVGVVKVSGHLVSGEVPPWALSFGVTGYGNIQQALVSAVADKQAKSIMLHVNSGGGSVNGVMATSDFIKKVGTVKPVSAYSDYAASAAYWLASSAGHITSDIGAINGSIGVIQIHQEASKRDEKEGITTTVMRAGEYKTLLNPYEPATEEALAQNQEILDDYYKLFTGAVADNRGTSPAIVDSVMAKGRVFLGARGIDVGLVDTVGSFDDAVAYSRSNKKLSTPNNAKVAGNVTSKLAGQVSVQDNATILSLQCNVMKFKLTQEQLAALAAGASLEELTGQTVEASEGAPATAGAAPAEAPEAVVPSAIEAELAAAKVELAAAQEDVLAKEAALADALAISASLQDVVQASVKQMSIALNRTVDFTGMSAQDVLSLHASTKADMVKTYKTTAVIPAASAETEKLKAEAVRNDAAFLAQASSIKF